MSEALQPAYLISSIPYKETSVIAKFFTLEQGLVSAVVKGVRKAKSKIFLQPFTPLMVSFYGKGDLKSCAKLEVASQPIWLTGKALACGWYMNELVGRILPEQMSAENLFKTYASYMPTLKDESKILISLREFEMSLLNTLGINPHFIAADGADILADRIYTYMDNRGFVPTQAIINTMSFYGDELLAIKHSDWDTKSLFACKRLTNYFITPLLGNKPLESRKLLIKGF